MRAVLKSIIFMILLIFAYFTSYGGLIGNYCGVLVAFKGKHGYDTVNPGQNGLNSQKPAIN